MPTLARPSARIALGAAACALVAVLLCAPEAAARELRIDSFDAKIEVEASGRIEVTETIRVHFIGSWQGFYRSIPVDYLTPQAMSYALRLNVLRATDDKGVPLRVEASHERQYRKLKIYVPEAADTQRTILLAYEVFEGLRFFDNYDELYWNVTGDEWDVPIQAASASVILPPGAGGVRANVHTGAYGSRANDADFQIIGNRVDIRMRHPLGFHEGMTASVAWDKGVVRAPTTLDYVALFLRNNWPLSIPLPVLAFMWTLWYRRGRDPRRGPVVVQYGPPDGLTPGEVGALVDGSVDMRDLTASIVDLAVRGFLVIEEQEKAKGHWGPAAKDYAFCARKSRAEWAPLKAHEQSLLAGLFRSGAETIRLGDLHNKFYQELPRIKSDVFDALVRRGYYRHRPDRVRIAWVGGGVLFGALLGLASAFLVAGDAAPPTLAPALVVAALVSGAIVCAFGWFMPARTSGGARALDAILGLEDFLVHVEAERFDRMKTPEMFEKLLAYAMALRVERNWSRAFRTIYTQPPDWYTGGIQGRAFDSAVMTESVSAMSSQAQSDLSSAPRSSGDSGFGGGSGGSSGGGFGGGGGGGF